MKTPLRIIQIAFALSLLVFGLNGFFAFLPLPEKTGFTRLFMDTLHESGYMMPLIASIQIVAGVTLLWNRYKLLGQLLLAPVAVNIFLFHLFYDQAALAPAVVILVLNLVFLAKTGFFKQITQGNPS